MYLRTSNSRFVRHTDAHFTRVAVLLHATEIHSAIDKL